MGLDLLYVHQNAAKGGFIGVMFSFSDSFSFIKSPLIYVYTWCRHGNDVLTNDHCAPIVTLQKAA